jgi:hypothetical protein
MKKSVSDTLLIILGLTVLLAIALDASRTGKSADKRSSYLSDARNKSKPKTGLIYSDGIDNSNTEPNEPNEHTLQKQLGTARVSSFHDPDVNRESEPRAGSKKYLTNHANGNLSADDLEGTADDLEDAADDSQDDAAACVE